MNITEKVETVVNKQNYITNSQFYNDYQSLMAKYMILIEKGVINKRQSQLCSISDKLNHIAMNCNNYRIDDE